MSIMHTCQRLALPVIRSSILVTIKDTSVGTSHNKLWSVLDCCQALLLRLATVCFWMWQFLCVYKKELKIQYSDDGTKASYILCCCVIQYLFDKKKNFEMNSVSLDSVLAYDTADMVCPV